MSSWTGLSSTGATEDQARSAEPRRNRNGIGKIVVLTMGVGLAAAVLLPFIPWPTVDANVATAMVLFGFAAIGVGRSMSTEAIAAAIFPLSSPFAMIARAAEQSALWPHLLALIWQGLWVALILKVASAVFRRSVLKSGKSSRRWWRRNLVRPRCR